MSDVTFFPAAQPRARRVRQPKERFDWAGLMGDLLSGGMGLYGSKYIADKQGDTAKLLAEINAGNLLALGKQNIEGQKEIYGLGEADRASQRALTQSGIDAQRDQSKVTQASLDALREDVVRRFTEGQIGTIGAEAEDAGNLAAQNAFIANANQAATAQVSAPRIDRVTAKAGNPLTGDDQLGPLFGLDPSIEGFTKLKAEAMASGNPTIQNMALSAIEEMRSNAEEARTARIHPFARLANSVFGMGPGAELDALIDEMDNYLGSSAASSVREKGVASAMPPEFAKANAVRAFGPRIRAAADQGRQSLRGIYDIPPATQTYFPDVSIAPAPRRVRVGPWGASSPVPTTEEVHTPLDPNAGAMGPMGDIGRMMAIRKLEELGLVA